MQTGNYLSPRLVALAKDNALKIFLDSWDSNITFKEIKESLSSNTFSDEKISINKSFIDMDKIELCNRIDYAYSISISLIMDTLKFLGRPNDGTKIEWDHSHNH